MQTKIAHFVPLFFIPLWSCTAIINSLYSTIFNNIFAFSFLVNTFNSTIWQLNSLFYLLKTSFPISKSSICDSCLLIIACISFCPSLKSKITTFDLLDIGSSVNYEKLQPQAFPSLNLLLHE